MPEAVLDIYTPFGLRRSVCRDLDEHVHASTGLNIGQLLCSRQTLEERPLYEYLMYSAYLHAHGGGIERFHQLSPTSLSLTYLCNDPKVGPEAMLGGTRAERYRMVGVHRRVGKADISTRTKFAELFRSFRLVASVEEGLHFLEATV
ncbi:hypothetical protein [Falsiroseomonas sp. E2-1-a20]|uniref:hypothetical protein n=1 Tax=Falsiroseomonas sp. E2-1-a20 TaxID=3239300 RepID=UPI003F361B67